MEPQLKRRAVAGAIVGPLAPHRVRVTMFSYVDNTVTLFEMCKPDFTAAESACFHVIVHSNTPKEKWPLLARWLFENPALPSGVERLITIDMSNARWSLHWDSIAQIVYI